MKPHFISILAALASASSAYSQSNWVSTGTITVALTLTQSVEALKMKDELGKVIPVKDGGGPTFENNFSVETNGRDEFGDLVPIKTVSTREYGSKFSVMKWGNADIIKALVELETLPQKGNAPHTAGWSLVFIYGIDGVPTQVVARHTDKTTIDVPEILLDDPWFEIEALTEKEVLTDNTPINKEPTSSSTWTYSKISKGTASINVPVLGEEVPLTGKFTRSLKLVVKKEKIEGENFSSDVFVPGAWKLEGFHTSAQEMLLEGSVSIGAGAIVNFDAYMPAE